MTKGQEHPGIPRPREGDTGSREGDRGSHRPPSPCRKVPEWVVVSGLGGSFDINHRRIRSESPLPTPVRLEPVTTIGCYRMGLVQFLSPSENGASGLSLHV